MHKFILLSVATLVLFVASSALAMESSALVGKWQLVEPARDKGGKPCPFVGEQIEFTADGKMISANMPVPFAYKINPDKGDAAGVIARNPELKGMEIMLASPGRAQTDWSKAPIAYGIELKGNQLTMKISGYTPAQYKKQK